MKNIHVLPTEKPSKLCYDRDDNLLFAPNAGFTYGDGKQHLYITDDSEIEAGDYWIYICPINGLDYGDNNNPIVKNNLPTTWFEKLHDKENYKKIILTTDPQLIAGNVQAIDDDFLEWFVKNPSCERVEVVKEGYKKNGMIDEATSYRYKIIIPREEPKQETLEEVAERVFPDGISVKYTDMNIEDNQEYFGKMINNWTPDLKNKYVITGFISGKENIANNRVGRVAQVRLEAGDYGSDCVLLRHKDGTLTPHENQSFWLIPDKFKDYLDNIFKEVYLDDSDKHFYTLQGKKRKKGFIVKSPIKGNKSTPMRDIKNAISSKLDEIIKQSS